MPHPPCAEVFRNSAVKRSKTSKQKISVVYWPIREKIATIKMNEPRKNLYRCRISQENDRPWLPKARGIVFLWIRLMLWWLKSVNHQTMLQLCCPPNSISFCHFFLIRSTEDDWKRGERLATNMQPNCSCDIHKNKNDSKERKRIIFNHLAISYIPLRTSQPIVCRVSNSGAALWF